MNTIETPQTRCRAAIARCDITPPSGIYHRMWGAATHERATGVHRPFLATVLRLEPAAGDKSQAMMVVTLDHCLLDGAEIALYKSAVAAAAAVNVQQVQVCVTHTHAAGLMSRTRAALPGGELIAPYLDGLAHQLAELAATAMAAAVPVTIVYGRGHCDLAANRDYFDHERQQFVCGFNPDGPADDTVMIAKLVADGGHAIGTIVNYACHPTTLAWQNTLISPDYIGALRETVERQTDAPCIFLQGASADLGPREGFVGDVTIADRNGRQLAYAALSALEPLPSPGTEFVYAGAIVSGATIGTWQHRNVTPGRRERHASWHVNHGTMDLSYRADLPTIVAARSELASWQAREEESLAAGQVEQAREYHARVEQAQRQLWRLESLPQPAFPLPVSVARMGDAIWLFLAGEHYQNLQTELRARFPARPIVVTTIANGWQPGYIPPAEIYGRGIYQEQIAVVAPGSAEQLIAAISARLESLIG